MELARTAPEARAAGTTSASCTGWATTLTPPLTIRVLRSKRPEVYPEIAGSVEEIPFRDYVGVVLAAEWPGTYPREALRAGASSVKQYGWYFAIVYRGGEVELPDGTTACYDVVDTTQDQVYHPEERSPRASHLAAIDATWGITLRRYRPADLASRFFLTGYRSGSTAVRGAEANGWKLFARSVVACARDGLTFREILRLYLEPRLEIVEPGRHDIVGMQQGNASALVRAGSRHAAHVWTPGWEPPTLSSETGLAIAADALVGVASSDLDADGRDDLLWLIQTGATTGRLRVALGEAHGYGQAKTWFDGDLRAPLAGAQLLSGDFDGDGRWDAAVLAHGAEPGRAVLRVLKKLAGSGLSSPVRWWLGVLALEDVKAWAGDVTGDGRADLIVRQDLPTGGIRISTALALRPPPGLGPLKTRLTDTTVVPGRTLRPGAHAEHPRRRQP